HARGTGCLGVVGSSGRTTGSRRVVVVPLQPDELARSGGLVRVGVGGATGGVRRGKLHHGTGPVVAVVAGEVLAVLTGLRTRDAGRPGHVGRVPQDGGVAAA